MPVHALLLTAGPASPAAAGQQTNLTLIVFVALAFLAYFLSCLIHPWKRCVVCQDRKKFPAKSRTFRMCPYCHGRGRQYRIGTRIIRGIFGFGFDKFN